MSKSLAHEAERMPMLSDSEALAISGRFRRALEATIAA
jgi:hypothetical protein